MCPMRDCTVPGSSRFESLETRLFLSSAQFLGVDSTFAGDWRGGFGADGYVIPAVANSLPAYATMTTADALTYTWSSPATDTRALAHPDQSSRTASTLYGGTFSVDLHLTDGPPRQVAFYLLDWDRQNRSETLSMIDGDTGAVLDTRTTGGFTSGKYFVYNLSGTVKLQLSLLTGANTVLGGIFFGGASPSAPNHAPVVGALAASLPEISQDDTENRGIAITELVSLLSISDPDMNALAGLAITGTDQDHGVWQYTTGANRWLALDDTSATMGRLLATTPSNRIRFIPAPGFHGSASFTARAWDRTINVNGGLADITTTGGAAAFSSELATATIQVAEVRTAPQLPGMNSLSVKVGQTLQVVLPQALNGDSGLTYALGNLPSGATFDPSTRTLTWTPDALPTGRSASPNSPVLPIDLTGWNYDAVTENASGAFAQAFDADNGAVSWFESGLEDHPDGLPAGAGNYVSPLVNSITGGHSTFLFQPYDRNNVLILKDYDRNTRALYFKRPMRLSSLSLLAASNRVGNRWGMNLGFMRLVYFEDGDTGATSSTDGNFPLPGGIGDPDRANAAPYDASSWWTDFVYEGGKTQAPSALANLGHNASIGEDGTGFQYSNDRPAGMYETDRSLMNGFRVSGVVTDLTDKYIQAICFRKADSAPGGVTGIFAVSGAANDATPAGAVDLTYTVSDGQVLTTRTLRIWVQDDSNVPVNHAPISSADSYAVNHGATLSVPAPGILSNDIDPDGDPITATLIQAPASAANFLLNPNGSFAYTPRADFSGQDTFTYVTSDGSIASAPATVTLTVKPIVAVTAGADFLKLDATTQGNWKSAYGAEGHAIANESVSYPDYAQLRFSGALTYTWASSPTEIQAMQRSVGSGRIASTWYGGSFTVDLNLTDGQTHRVALYLLDWDHQSRSVQVDVVDADTETLLNRQSLSDFSAGKYLLYNLRGHVEFRLSLLRGANTVLGGLFFGGNAPAADNHAPVLTTPTIDLHSLVQDAPPGNGWNLPNLLGRVITDDADGDPAGIALTSADNTHGDWQYSIDSGTTWNSLASVAPSTALLLSDASENRIRFLPAAGYVGPAAFTFRAWDRTAGSNGAIADTSTFGGATAFSDQSCVATVQVVTSANSDISASFISADSSTRGNWQGTYGSEGFSIAGDSSSVPSYATVTASGQSSWVWDGASASAGALQRTADGGRVAATWYSSTSFDIEVNFTDGNSHTVAAYLLDYDNRGRMQQIEVIDANSGAVLDTQTLSGFQNGTYLSWRLSGHVILRFTNLTGPNAVLSGLFFG